MDQIDALKQKNDKVGLVYIYSVIAKKLIFYPILNLTIDNSTIPY
jgi:hypothetical protein